MGDGITVLETAGLVFGFAGLASVVLLTVLALCAAIRAMRPPARRGGYLIPPADDGEVRMITFPADRGDDRPAPSPRPPLPPPDGAGAGHPR